MANNTEIKTEIRVTKKPKETPTPFSEDFGFFLEQFQGPLDENFEYNLLTKEEEYILFTNLIRLRGAIILFELNQTLPKEHLLVDKQYWEKQLPYPNRAEWIEPMHELLLYRYNRIMNILMQYNEGLVKSFANSSDQDLLQAGRLGLLRAIQDFNPERENKFSTYAVWWIIQGIRRHRFQDHLIHQPEYIQLAISKYNKIESILFQILKRTPTYREILEYANKNNVNLGDIHYLWLVLRAKEPMSLDKPLNPGSDITLYHFIHTTPDNNNGSCASTPISRIQEIIEQICENSRKGERNKEIFWSRYSQGGGTMEGLNIIAKKYGITEERVRQIIDNLTKKVQLEFKTKIPNN